MLALVLLPLVDATGGEEIGAVEEKAAEEAGRVRVGECVILVEDEEVPAPPGDVAEVDEDEADDGRCTLTAVAGLRGTGDEGGRGGRAADDRDSGERGERGDDGTGDSDGDRLGDRPATLPARNPTLLPLPLPVAAEADDDRARDAAVEPVNDEADEDDEGDGEAGERGERREEEVVGAAGRCSFDCTVRGGLPARLASVLGLAGTTRGCALVVCGSSCLRCCLGELCVVEATDELLDVGTKMRGGRMRTASSKASASSNSILRSLAVDEWRLCRMERLPAAASGSSGTLFSSSSDCCLSDVAN